MNPYRTNEQKASTVKLPRLKARVRGLIRRVAIPTFWVASLGAFLCSCGALEFSCADTKAKNAEADAARHFADWERAAGERDAKLNAKQAEIDKREAELNARVRSFEDILAIAPALMKGDPSDIARTLNVIKKQK